MQWIIDRLKEDLGITRMATSNEQVNKNITGTYRQHALFLNGEEFVKRQDKRVAELELAISILTEELKKQKENGY